MILTLILLALVAITLLHGRDYSISADEYRAEASYWNERGQHTTATACRRLAYECDRNMRNCRNWACLFSGCAVMAAIVMVYSWLA